MKKIKTIFALILGFMCVGVTMPVKAASIPIDATQVKETRGVSYTTKVFNIANVRVEVLYHVSISSNGVIQEVAIDKVSSNGGLLVYSGADISIKKVNASYTWKVTISPYVVIAGDLYNGTPYVFTVSSGPQ